MVGISLFLPTEIHIITPFGCNRPKSNFFPYIMIQTQIQNGHE